MQKVPYIHNFEVLAELATTLEVTGKELERECELSHLEAYEMKECWRIAGELEEFI